MTSDPTGDLRSVLERNPVFAGLSAESLERIAPCFGTVAFAQGEAAFREGDPGDCLYIVARGAFDVLKDMGWGQRPLQRLGPGDLFGEMALISRQVRTATLCAVAASECFVMNETAFGDLLEREPAFGRRILSLLTQRLRDSDELAGRDVVRAHQALIISLAQLAESRDPETGAHIFRVRDYCVSLAERLAEHPHFHGAISSAFLQSIYLVSPLHDIGKVAIPDRILLKPAKLTEDEFHLMQSHTERGAAALRTVLGFCDHEMFHMAYRVVLHHHERYDGKGYPAGIAGEAIPLEARIMSLADTFDALVSRRVYKQPFTCDQARDEILGATGTRFDPLLVGVFIDHIDAFSAIHRRYEE